MFLNTLEITVCLLIEYLPFTEITTSEKIAISRNFFNPIKNLQLYGCSN